MTANNNNKLLHSYLLPDKTFHLGRELIVTQGVGWDVKQWDVLMGDGKMFHLSGKLFKLGK